MSFILPSRLQLRGSAVCVRGRANGLLLTSVLLASMWLAGCAASVPKTDTAPVEALTPAASASAQAAATSSRTAALNPNLIYGLLQQAETAPSPQRESLLLQASAYYQQQGDYTRMGRVLGELRPETLTASQRADYSLQYGDWALDRRRLDDAARVLFDPQLPTLLADTQQGALLGTLHGLRARLLELQGKPIDALNERMIQSLRTPEAGQGEIATAVWRLLAQLGEADFQFLENADTQNRPEEQMLSGWLALARIQREMAGNASRQAAAVKDWQRSYPLHPANRHMPADLAAVTATASDTGSGARRIALLLPLTGKRAAAGQALRDGFMTMHYQQMSSGASNVQVDLVDTGTAPDFLNLYQQTVAQGAQTVVGPLEKEQVQLLAGQASLPVPTLALNNPLNPDSAGSDQLYQFSLNPEDDVAQVAAAALGSRLKRALVIAPQGERGERLLQAFARSWQQGGGDMRQVRYAPGTGNYSVAIAEGLGVDLASGQLQPGKSLPDMVFLISNSVDVGALMESLSRNGAASVPVYATAQVLGGRLDVRSNGLRVCLAPVQGGVGPLRSAKIDVPADNDTLFAMGADAQALSSQLVALSGNSSLHIPGNTGYLSMDSRRRIQRALVWAVVQDGQLVLQPATANGRF